MTTVPGMSLLPAERLKLLLSRLEVCSALSVLTEKFDGVPKM